MNNRANCQNEGQQDSWLKTYQASAYAFVHLGSWLEFALDGGDSSQQLALASSVTLITAWNPASSERDINWNRSANAGLLRRIVAAGVDWSASRGASLPGTEPSWREDGFCLHGLGMQEASDWGRDVNQRAVVYLVDDRAGLLFCDQGQFVSCGLRMLSTKSAPSRR